MAEKALIEKTTGVIEPPILKLELAQKFFDVCRAMSLWMGSATSTR